MRAKAHNYDLYSFSAIFSPNILQFIHNSASCNIPLRWDGTRNITPVSIIYHGTLHTNQLILIVHSHCRNVWERKIICSPFRERSAIIFFFSRNINSIPYLRPRFRNARSKNCGDFVVSTTKCAIQSKIFKPLTRTRFASLSAQFLQYTSEYSPSLTPELAELFIETE